MTGELYFASTGSSHVVVPSPRGRYRALISTEKFIGRITPTMGPIIKPPGEVVPWIGGCGPKDSLKVRIPPVRPVPTRIPANRWLPIGWESDSEAVLNLATNST